MGGYSLLQLILMSLVGTVAMTALVLFGRWLRSTWAAHPARAVDAVAGLSAAAGVAVVAFDGALGWRWWILALLAPPILWGAWRGWRR